MLYLQTMKSRDDKPPRAWNSTIARRTKGIERTPLTGPVGPTRKPKPRKPVKRVNAKRKASEFRRCYHSTERVEWAKSLPCVASGVLGNIENVHVVGDGAGRKSDYTNIVPLTRELHRQLHRIGAESFQAAWHIDL